MLLSESKLRLKSSEELNRLVIWSFRFEVILGVYLIGAVYLYGFFGENFPITLLPSLAIIGCVLSSINKLIRRRCTDSLVNRLSNGDKGTVQSLVSEGFFHDFKLLSPPAWVNKINTEKKFDRAILKLGCLFCLSILYCGCVGFAFIHMSDIMDIAIGVLCVIASVQYFRWFNFLSDMLKYLKENKGKFKE